MRVQTIGGYRYLVIKTANNKSVLIPVSGLSDAALKRWRVQK